MDFAQANTVTIPIVNLSLRLGVLPTQGWKNQGTMVTTPMLKRGVSKNGTLVLGLAESTPFHHDIWGWGCLSQLELAPGTMTADLNDNREICVCKPQANESKDS